MNPPYTKKMLARARYIVQKNNNYSISFLQRTLEVSYTTASILIHILRQEQN